jgi:hypothetical protein
MTIEKFSSENFPFKNFGKTISRRELREGTKEDEWDDCDNIAQACTSCKE